MKVKIWLIRVLISVLVALPAPVIIAAALSAVPAVAEWSVSELVNATMMPGKLAAYFAVLVAAFVLVLIGQSISGPITARLEEDDREEGLVKWFNVSKGFGFVTRESGDDVFVHFRSIRGRGHRSLQEGQRVRFGVVESAKGLQAEDVTIVRQK